MHSAVARAANRWWQLITIVTAALSAAVMPAVLAQQPYGLDSRAAIAPYLNGHMPGTQSAVVFPAVLSATGAFRNVKSMTPADGLVTA